MTVKELASHSEFRVLSMPSPERAVAGVYIGDLLSRVMGQAKSDCAWVTIMSNINVIAVATLTDAACVILAEDVEADEELLAVANQKGVNIFSVSLSAYETALKLHCIKMVNI